TVRSARCKPVPGGQECAGARIGDDHLGDRIQPPDQRRGARAAGRRHLSTLFRRAERGRLPQPGEPVAQNLQRVAVCPRTIESPAAACRTQVRLVKSLWQEENLITVVLSVW